MRHVSTILLQSEEFLINFAKSLEQLNKLRLFNDTQVLYHMFEAYNEIGPAEILYTDVLSGLASFFVVAIGGTIIGVIWGFGTGFVTRFTHQVRVIEPIFIFVMAYLAYLNAEIFHMSSILAWVNWSSSGECFRDSLSSMIIHNWYIVTLNEFLRVWFLMCESCEFLKEFAKWESLFFWLETIEIQMEIFNSIEKMIVINSWLTRKSLWILEIKIF